MTELLNNYWQIILLYFPLGAIGLYRWSVWITKKVVARKYKPVAKNGYGDTLSIVIPVYNEEPPVFQRALASWLGNNPDEIIAVIDHTDQVCIKIFKKFQTENKNSQLIITKRPGKRQALADGIKAAKYNIIALVDSDTIWDPDIKETLLTPFADPSVGGVGPRQDVLDTNTLARRLFNIHLDHRYFDEMTYLAVVGNALTCLSGRTALYRKEAIKDLVEKLENETFWGIKCISGDDKCLTRLVQEKGWKVRYQGNVRVLTPGASDLRTLFKQQLRWTRNSYRSDLKSITSKWIWKREKLLAYHMIDRFTQPFTLIIGPIYLIFSIIWGYWLAAGILLVWWHLSRGIKLYSHFKHRPADILILPFYILTTYLMAVLKIYALITIRQQGWITRWAKSRLQNLRGLQGGINHIFRVFKSTVPYLTTASILVLLSFGVVKYKDFTSLSKDNGDLKPSPIVRRFESLIGRPIKSKIINDCPQVVSNNIENQPFGYYIVEPDDNLSLIAKKYNSNLSAMVEANKDIVTRPNYLKIGQQLKIPVLELRNALQRNGLVTLIKPEIKFDLSSLTVSVEGRGVVTLPQIYEALNQAPVLEKLNNKEWLLKTNLLVKKGVTLVIDDSEVSWLKLKSDQTGFVWLQSNGGNILIKNTKITSWDAGNQTPDTNYEDGRSFILAKQNGRMDILGSELSFLGQENGLKSGVAWHATDNSANSYLITGQVINSKFYHNYSGLYLSGTTEVIIANNEVADSAEYGISVRHGATNLLINNNWIHDDRNYNFITQKYCPNDITDKIYSNNRVDQAAVSF